MPSARPTAEFPPGSHDQELLQRPHLPGHRLRVGGEEQVLSCSLREDHYGVLTEALVIDKTPEQVAGVKDPGEIARGGQCRRVLYTPGQDTWAAMRYTGAYQIQKSREEALAVELRLPGTSPAFPGDVLEVSLPRMGLEGAFRVAEVENTFTAAGGALAAVTMKERV